jgi:proline iminopeptidase
VRGAERARRSARAVATAPFLVLFVACRIPVEPIATGLLDREDGARIAWVAVGRGTPMIVVHGGPGMDHRYLRPGLDVLGSAHRLLYYDQRGTGGSEAPLDSGSVNLGMFVADIEALRVDLGTERVLVLAHSFGSQIALAYAMAHPERVRGLVLLNPVEPGTRFRDATARRLAAARSEEDAKALRSLAESAAFQASEPLALERMYRIAYRATVPDPSVIDRLDLTIVPRTARNGADVLGLLGTSLGGLDWWDELESLQVPTLLVHGRAEPTPLEMSRALAAALPEARLVVLDTGHFPYVEAPQALYDAVTGFTAELAP